MPVFKTIFSSGSISLFLFTFLFSSFGFSQDVSDCSSFQVVTIRAGQPIFSSDFEAAVDAAQSGDEILVGNGTFPRVRVRDKSNIVIKSTCSSVIQSFVVRRSNNIRIEGFEVTDTSGDKSGIYLGSNANANSNIQIVGNKIHGMTPNGGVRVRIGNSNILIENNEMFGNQNAIIVNGASEITIKNNIIRDNLKNGIKITNMSGNVVIEGNDIFGNAKNGIVTLDHDPSGSVSIKNNQIHENTLDGINIGRGSVAVSVENNDIFGNANGIDVTRNVGDGPIDLTSNTIRDNNKNGVHIKGDSIVNLTNNLIENNGLGGDGNNGYGIKKKSNSASERVTLTNNTIINNNGRVVDGQRSIDLHDFTKILDSTDSGNITTGGNEGPGVSNDTVSPVISAINLVDGQLVTQNPFTLEFSVEDESPRLEVYVTVNLSTQFFVSNTTDKTFSVPVSFVEGAANSVIVLVRDETNNQTEHIIQNIGADSIGPQLSINFTDGQDVFLDTSRLLDFQIVSNEPTESVTINGIEAFGFNQDFSLTLAASNQNTQEFIIVAEDTAGNISQQTITLNYTVDTERPIITVTQTDDVFTSQENFPLNISINDIADTTTKVFVNGTQTLESPDKTISTSVPLNLGRNEIRITSIDSAGNVAVPVVLDNVNFDNRPINLTIGSPGLGDELTESIANISGASDKELSAITVNGLALQLSENKLNFSGTFDFGNATGELLLNFVATDLYGNTANLSHPVFIREVVRKNLAYFTDSSSGKLLVYDSDDFSFVREIQVNEPDQDDPTNGRIANLALSVDKKRAFVVGTTKESVFVVDLEQNVVSASQVINLKQDPNVAENTSLIHNKPIQVAESGIHTYFISAFLPEILFDGQTVPDPAVPARLFIYDNQANTFSSFELPGLDPESMIVDSSGSKIYMSTSSNSIAVVDTVSRSVSETINIPVSALKSNDLVLSNDESDIFVSSSESNLLYRIDLTSKQLEQSIDLGGLQEGLVRLGSGNKIYALVNKNGSSFISTVDESTNTVSVEIDLGFQATKMKANIDLSQIWVTSESSSQVKIYDIATNAVTNTFAVNSPLDVDFGYIDEKSTANIPPLASFTFSPSESVAPAVYSFDASSSRDLDGNIASYQWVIEGQSYSGQSVMHRFEQPGTFTAALTVTDNSSESRTRTVNVSVGDQNALPVANFYSQAETDFGLLKIRFDASSSFKTGGEISEYRWDFGNGKTGAGADVTHQYEAIGTYLVTLTVVDNFGVSASATKSVSPTDVTPLGLSILSPRPGHLTNSSSVTIVGSTDEDSPMIKVAGERVLPAADKSFAKDVSLSTQGLNIITVEAQDNAGNNNRLNLPIIYDSVAPILSNLTPVDGTTVYQKDGNVLVSVEANEPISSLSVNGVSFAVQNNAQRTFTGVVPFNSSGTGALSVSATDLAGNTGTLSNSFELVIDADAPVIAFNEEPPALTNQASFNLSVIVTDATPVTTVIELNGSAVANNSQISFSSGNNSIKVTSTDSAGNESVVERSILLDNVAPDSQLSLNDGFLTNQSSISIQARIFDAGNISSGIFLNGSLVQSSTESVFDAQLNLQEGSNTVTLTSGDEAGNVASQKEITIILDTTPPVISNIRPETGTVVGLRTLDLFISAESNEPLSSLSIDGQEMGVNIADIFFQDRLQLFGDGPVTLNFAATDKAGNQVQFTHNVETVLDSTDPVLTIVGVTENQQFISKAVPIGIIVQDNSTVRTQIFLNDLFLFESTENNFNYDLPLNEGANTLKVVATDSVERSVETVISNIVLDSKAPELSIASPTDGQVFEDSNIQVSFTSNEPLSQVIVGGSVFAQNGATSFDQTIDIMQVGAIGLSIQAFDMLGNEKAVIVPINVEESSGGEPGDVLAGPDRNHGCAIVSGQLFCWGKNSDGEVGDGTRVEKLSPVSVPTMEAGVTNFDVIRSLTCAIKDSQLYCWGQEGNIGVVDFDPARNPPVLPILTPTLTPNFTGNVTSFSAGGGSVCAVKDEAVYCWGRNFMERLGFPNTGSDIVYTEPVLVPGLESNMSQVVHGSSVTCALTTAGVVKCWGSNSSGQLGIGTVSSVETPTDVIGISESVTQISSLAGTSCAVTTSGKLYCWGLNGFGQIGDGTKVNKTLPTEIFASGIQSVSTSGRTTCAVTIDGAAKCWGDNLRGQLGNGTISNTYTTPQDVFGLDTGVASIRAGNNLTCATMLDGMVKCWGGPTSNSSEPTYLGDGTTNPSTIPVTLDTLPLPGPTQPNVIANISASPIRGKIPLDLNLMGGGSFSTNGTISSYSWKINGAEVSTAENFTQTLTAAGQQEVMLTVTDSTGESASKSIIVIAEEDEAPVALFSYVLNIADGVHNVAFNADISFDKDNSISSYEWSFGDGTTGSGEMVNHQYLAEGTYEVLLTVTSDNNQQAMVTREIVVKDVVPAILTITSPVTGEKSKRSFVLSGSSSEKLQRLTLNGSSIALAADQVSFSQSYSMNKDGVQTLELEAIDLSGNKSRKQLIIDFDSKGPVLTNIVPADGSTVYSQNGMVQLRANSDEELSSVTVNGVVGLLIGNNDEILGPFQISDSEFTDVEVVATDLVGNTTTKKIKIRHEIDTSLPVLSATGSQSGFTQDNSFAIDVNASDNSPLRVEIYKDGLKIHESTQNVFTFNTTLDQGANNFEVKAIDSAENETTASLETVTLDNQAPQVFLSSPSENDVLENHKFTVIGSVSEALSSLTIGGQSITVNADLSFEQEIEAPSTGPFSLDISGVDLAGNTVTYQQPLTFDLILVPNLISIHKIEGSSKILVTGAEGSTKPNTDVRISHGFFGSGSATSDAQGQFSIEMSPFTSAKIRATNGSLSAEADLFYQIQTSISGIVKNIDGQSLPGVKVRVSGTSSVGTTDISGAFRIDNPPTGDQKLIIDASVLNTDNIKYSNTSISVSVGLNDANVMEDTVYLAPVVMDGTETLVTESGGASISHPNVPGVSVNIPSGVKAIFPDGGNQGVASVRKSLSSAATTPVPDFAVPDEIIHLEPSGLRFEEPVELIVPNDNELPPGVELVIMSMDTERGMWEIDGIAKVDPSGSFVKTKKGMGITHFSPKYAVPIGPVIQKYTNVGQRGVNTLEGGLRRSLELPSFKALGESITPTLVYNSAWAKPTATVTNYLSIPEQRVQYTFGQAVTASGGGLFSRPDIKKDFCFRDKENESSACFDDFFEYWRYQDNLAGLQVETTTSWYEPDQIKTNFFVSGLAIRDLTEEFEDRDVSRINAEEGTWGELPNQTLISFGLDLKDKDGNYFKSGLYPSLARYDIKLKRITIRSIKFLDILKDNGFFAGGREKDRVVRTILDTPEPERLKKVFPSSVSAPVYVQNQVNSAVGRGWRVAGVKKIANPGAGRIILEEDDGSMSLYTADLAIETLVDLSNENVDLRKGISLNAWPTVALPRVKEDSNTELVTVDLSRKNPILTSLADLPVTSGSLRAARLCPVGERRKADNEKFVEDRWNFSIPKSVESLILLPGGKIYGMDSREHALFESNGAGFSNLAGYQGPLLSHRDYQNNNTTSLQSWCQAEYGTDCVKESGHIKVENCPNFFQVKNFQAWYKYTSHGATAEYNNNANINTGTVPAKTETLEGFKNPMGIAGGPDGFIYVADGGNNRIVKVDPNSGQIFHVAGNGDDSDYGDGGLPTSAGIYHPRGLVFDAAGNLYVTTERGFVRKITSSGAGSFSNIETFAGSDLDNGEDLGQLEDRADATRFAMAMPTGIAIDSGSQLMYVADTLNNRVVQIDMVSKTASLIAGNGDSNCTSLGDGGSALNACLSAPTWIGLDDGKNLVIADSGNKRIRRVSLNGNILNASTFKPTNKDNSELKKLADGSYERHRRNGVIDKFDPNGLHTSTLGRYGREVKYTYNIDGNIESIEDIAGRLTQFQYSGEKVTSISTPSGETTFSYDDGMLSQVTFPDGTTKTYQYDADGLMLEERNQRDIATAYEYNEYSKLSKVTRADGTETVIKGHLDDTYIDPDSEVTKLASFDRDMVGAISIDGSEKVSHTRDIYGHLQQVTDAQGRTTIFSRNSSGLIDKVVRPDNSVQLIDYYPDTLDVKRVEEVDIGETREYVYNNFGQITSEKINGRETARVYDLATGLLSLEVAPNGRSTAYEYFPNGLIKSLRLEVDTANFSRRDYLYDTLGNLTQYSDSNGALFTYGYDNAGNRLSETATVLSGVSRTTEYTYDEFNRLRTVKSPKNEITEYQYTTTGKLEKVIDPSNQEVIYDYDNLDRLTRVTNQLGQTNQYFYDNEDNLVREINQRNQTIRYIYDESNLLRQKVLPDDLYTYEYDVNNRLNRVGNKNSVVTMDYDSAGNLKSSEVMGIGDLSNYPVISSSYEYNVDSRVTSFSDNHGTNVTYAYDVFGRLNQIQSTQGFVYNYTHDLTNRIKSFSMPGMQLVIDYGNKTYPTSFDYSSSGTTKAFFNYSHNKLGQATEVISDRETASYTYGENNFLSNANRNYNESRGPASLPSYTNETFSHDEIGNRTSDSFGSHSYDSTKQQLTENWKNSFSYDAGGNLIGKVDKLSGEYTKYEYDSENQLVRIRFYETEVSSVAKKEIDYFYDALGRRMKKVVVDHDNPSDKRKTFTRQYGYDRNEMYLEFDEDSKLLARYLHSGLRTDDTLAVEVTDDGVTERLANQATTYNFLKNNIGSVTHIADTSGNIVQKQDYSSYGTLVRISDASDADVTTNPEISIPFAFANRELDLETGLYFNRARYYDSEVGRFLQRDPSPGKTEMPITLINKYIYGGNSPLAYIDPDGREFFTALLIASAIAGGVSAGITLINGGTPEAALNAFTSSFLTAIVIGSVGYLYGLAAGLGGLGPATQFLAGGLAGGTVGAAIAGETGGDPLLGFIGGFVGGGLAGLSGGAVGLGIIKSTVQPLNYKLYVPATNVDNVLPLQPPPKFDPGEGLPIGGQPNL